MAGIEFDAGIIGWGDDSVAPADNRVSEIEGQDVTFDAGTEGFDDESSETEEQTADGQSESGEDPDQASDPEDDAVYVEVKDQGEIRKIALNPDDEQLKETLQLGLGAKRWKAKVSEQGRTIKQLNEKVSSYESPEVQQKLEVMDTVQELANKGMVTQAMRALLGDGYDDFVKSILDYDAMDEQSRSAVDQRRERELAKWQASQSERKLSAREQMIKEREEALENQKYESMATEAYYANKLDVGSPELNEELNEALWQSAIAKLELISETREITPGITKKVFEQKKRAFEAAYKKKAEAEVDLIVKDKTEQAKKSASLRSQGKASPQKKRPKFYSARDAARAIFGA